MGIHLRHYRLLKDFELVNQFLRNNYQENAHSGNILQPVFESSHVNPAFNCKLASRFGMWMEGEKIIALACYKYQPGEAWLNTSLGYESMKPQMLDYAEQELSQVVNEAHSLHVFAMDHETSLISEMHNRNYRVVRHIPVTMYSYQKGFVHPPLPGGFVLTCLQQECDYKKLDALISKSSNHADMPSLNRDTRLLFLTAPDFRSDHSYVIKSPSGDYVNLVVMWLDESNHYAYMELIATDPAYRRQKLATIAVMEAMKRSQDVGITTCYGGSKAFYYQIGFDQLATIEVWYKEW